MINETSFNHTRKKLVEIYHSERARANLDLVYASKLRKLFTSKYAKESYLHKQGINAVLKEIGINN